ncbi:hypothetical protein [Aneurinibacillus danicus]|uniref:Uncharacterized protein n=1 Tax=Aneurinibacillus danicus TaxID=267746 RepID=A0A511V834_9BACL|nr:hypothetical protein [Aneurinibacillus danicus]GEN35097.1 hypothetical protein ADA01nite_25570 [Aneurinibacillus danicus]
MTWISLLYLFTATIAFCLNILDIEQAISQRQELRKSQQLNQRYEQLIEKQNRELQVLREWVERHSVPLK